MKCYYCNSSIRRATIICPVCDRQQDLSYFERASGYLRKILSRKNVHHRRILALNR